MHKLRKHRRQIASGFAKLSDDLRFLVALQLDKDVLFCREMEVERTPHDACGGGDGTDVSGGQSALRNLSQRGIEQTCPRFEPLGFPNAYDRRFGHGGSMRLHERKPYVYSLAPVNDSRQ